MPAIHSPGTRRLYSPYKTRSPRKTRPEASTPKLYVVSRGRIVKPILKKKQQSQAHVGDYELSWDFSEPEDGRRQRINFIQPYKSTSPWVLHNILNTFPLSLNEAGSPSWEFYDPSTADDAMQVSTSHIHAIFSIEVMKVTIAPWWYRYFHVGVRCAPGDENKPLIHTPTPSYQRRRPKPRTPCVNKFARELASESTRSTQDTVIDELTYYCIAHASTLRDPEGAPSSWTPTIRFDPSVQGVGMYKDGDPHDPVYALVQWMCRLYHAFYSTSRLRKTAGAFLQRVVCVAVGTFLASWDKRCFHSVVNIPSEDYVASALALCKFLGACANYNLLSPYTVQACTRILMNQASSTEHIQGIFHIIDYAGWGLWCPNTERSASVPQKSPQEAVGSWTATGQSQPGTIGNVGEFWARLCNVGVAGVKPPNRSLLGSAGGASGKDARGWSEEIFRLLGALMNVPRSATAPTA